MTPLKGLPEPGRGGLAPSWVQTCIVHLMRYSLNLVSYKDRKAVVLALKEIYRAESQGCCAGRWRRCRPPGPAVTRHWCDVAGGLGARQLVLGVPAYGEDQLAAYPATSSFRYKVREWK